ncbi:MAG: ABC transporter substrate-binding protein [Actinobacteria bacterium]|nr:ABC transporter substrate-binding protein [Actinomycetota bacterium]
MKGHTMESRFRVRPTILVLALVTAVAVTVAGCGGSASSVSLAGNNTGTRTGVPHKELSHLNWYTFYRPVINLVPAVTADYPEEMVSANLCESVVRLGTNYKLVPGLTDFKQNKAATEFTYTIRKGAKFWDGSPVTPADVIYSIETNTTAPIGFSNAQVGEEISSMTASGSNAVVVKLKSPDIRFNYKLAGNAGVVYEKKQAEAAGQNLGTPAGKIMCSGPYELGQWSPASSITIVRNEHYWSKDFKPLVKSITFSWPQNPETVNNAFTSGSLDGGWNVPPSIISPLQSSGAGEMYVGGPETGLQVYTLVPGNLEKGPISDPRIRHALSLAIDRSALAEKLFDGAAEPLYTLAPPGSFSYAKAAFKTAAAEAATGHDIERAKALIKQTGKPAPKLTLAYPAGDALATPTAVAIQSEAQVAGIEIELKPMPAAQYASLFEGLPEKNVDLIFSIYAPPVELDPLAYYQYALSEGGVDNFNAFSDPRTNKLLAEAADETNTDRRAELTLEVQKIFNEQLPWIPLESLPVTVWQGSKVTGAPTTFTYLASPWAAELGGK